MNAHPGARQRGFGLGLRGGWMEFLGLPVALVVVLGFIAWPAYSDRRIRAKVAQAIEQAEGAKQAVAAARASGAPKATWTPPPASDVVQSISIEASGAVVLRFAAGAVADDAAVLRLQPVEEPGKPLGWRCVRDARTPVAGKYLPSELRQQCG